VHVDRALLHDVEAFGRRALVEKIAALRHAAQRRKSRDRFKISRGQPKEQLTRAQRRGDRGAAERSQVGRHFVSYVNSCYG
jgi:hypothetical protein